MSHGFTYGHLIFLLLFFFKKSRFTTARTLLLEATHGLEMHFTSGCAQNDQLMGFYWFPLVPAGLLTLAIIREQETKSIISTIERADFAGSAAPLVSAIWRGNDPHKGSDPPPPTLLQPTRINPFEETPLN